MVHKAPNGSHPWVPEYLNQGINEACGTTIDSARFIYALLGWNASKGLT